MRKGLSRRTFLGEARWPVQGLLLAACGQAQMMAEEAPAKEEMKEEPKEAAKDNRGAWSRSGRQLPARRPGPERDLAELLG